MATVPVPLVHLLKADVHAVGQVLDVLGRPVGVFVEACLEELLLLVRKAMSWKSSLLSLANLVLWA